MTRGALLSPLLAIAACSVMPDAARPTFVDYSFDARYLVGDDGALHLPTSSRALVIRSLDLAPPPLSESFESDGRTLRFAQKSPSHGLAKIQLKPGADSRAKAAATAKGVVVGPPVVPFESSGGVTVQLIRTAEACWSTTFDTAGTNSASQYRARGAR